jgi:hypothetical protein
MVKNGSVKSGGIDELQTGCCAADNPLGRAALRPISALLVVDILFHLYALLLAP